MATDPTMGATPTGGWSETSEFGKQTLHSVYEFLNLFMGIFSLKLY